MMKTILTVTLLALLSGCANRPETIRASYVSHERFVGQDCGALLVKLTDSRRELDRVSRLQNEKANTDAVGVFLLGVPFSKLSGDHEGEVARLKGEVEAVETAQVKSGCFSNPSTQLPQPGLTPVQTRLEEARRMYNSGLITVDEYERLRKRILEEL
jgi:hypothetical protein